MTGQLGHPDSYGSSPLNFKDPTTHTHSQSWSYWTGIWKEFRSKWGKSIRNAWFTSGPQPEGGNCPPRNFHKRMQQVTSFYPPPKISVGCGSGLHHGRRKDFFQVGAKVVYCFTHLKLRKHVFLMRFLKSRWQTLPCPPSDAHGLHTLPAEHVIYLSGHILPSGTEESQCDFLVNWSRAFRILFVFRIRLYKCCAPKNRNLFHAIRGSARFPLRHYTAQCILGMCISVGQLGFAKKNGRLPWRENAMTRAHVNHAQPWRNKNCSHLIT